MWARFRELWWTIAQYWVRVYRKRAHIRCNAIFRTGQFFQLFFRFMSSETFWARFRRLMLRKPSPWSVDSRKHAGVVLAYRRDGVEKHKKQMLFSVGCFTDRTAADWKSTVLSGSSRNHVSDFLLPFPGDFFVIRSGISLQQFLHSRIFYVASTTWKILTDKNPPEQAQARPGENESLNNFSSSDISHRCNRNGMNVPQFIL